ncbi:DNA-binding transcriptional regulator, LysR family [Streptoalloteichus tenebrarius]|uniref:DNA-binding transcriptional regulator, LysR family n=1 Tax=Streptoalloteichus tenebrarius (strain ATCC 17920 / DSM 40477 / JCM 4838 / CBS 697.72 / NBRC 16177 / NCIMB 11028 / NRRL B-12390 / A12253. 1 / ISP 5477) TaxID=1933 RepID=A0ABT1I0R5_STRSD|nr:LysR family transcriptional regulator [Streptoalloteichus tenebrarius]MCP2261374.1 DNA-binding transcriptional regulator, LysR family [Streptoalloteichus tenebrarius]
MSLEIRHLRVLQAIAETGSLTQAAARLGLTQPALTSQLKRIERTIGGTLFERTRTGVRPTPYGQVVLSATRGVLVGMDHLNSLLRQNKDDAGSAALRIGTVGTRLTARWAALLEQQLGGMAVRIRTGSTSRSLVRLLAGDQLDAAEVHEVPGYELVWPEGVAHRVLQPFEPIHVALHRGHRLAHADAIPLAELARERWALEPPDETGVHGAFLAACAACGFTPQIHHNVSSSLAASHAVQAGVAVTLCLATSRENASMVVRRLVGDPIWVRRIVGWRTALPERVARAVRGSVVQAYLEQVDNNPCYSRWFADRPELRPDVGD